MHNLSTNSKATSAAQVSDNGNNRAVQAASVVVQDNLKASGLSRALVATVRSTTASAVVIKASQMVLYRFLRHQTIRWLLIYCQPASAFQSDLDNTSLGSNTVAVCDAIYFP